VVVVYIRRKGKSTKRETRACCLSLQRYTSQSEVHPRCQNGKPYFALSEAACSALRGSLCIVK
jgi:hypothetical protein